MSLDPPFQQPHAIATAPDSEFILTVEQALDRYSAAGHPRTPRSIQRYCAVGHLECRLVETQHGQKYLLKPESVDKHIAYIDEVTPANRRDASRQVATSRPAPINDSAFDRNTTTDNDPSRPVATPMPDQSRYVARLEGENEFLRTQVSVKDSQIKELTERARETNHLIAGLQTMLSPLLGAGERVRDTHAQNGEETTDAG